MSEELNSVRKNPKKVLGRGLDSLFGGPDLAIDEGTRAEAGLPRPTVAPQAAAPQVPETARVWTVGVEKVVPNREQPRKAFDQERLRELAASVKEKGILLPIIVRKMPDGKFEIVAGERRWRAAQLAGLKEVPVLIKPSENQEALELALIENIQRQDLNPMEEAEAYNLLSTRYKLTQQQIADKVGKERATVANLMRLSGLAKEVRDLVKSSELQLGQAKALLTIDDPTKQVEVAKIAVKKKMTVRALERLIEQINSAPQAGEIELETMPAHIIQPLVSELQRYFGTKVELDFTGNRSKLSIHFYSQEELNRFVDKLRTKWQ